jgi:hypothetical protein
MFKSFPAEAMAVVRPAYDLDCVILQTARVKETRTCIRFAVK